MLKTFLSGMVLTGLLFAQEKSVVITKIITEKDSTSEMTVDVTVEDNVLDFSIEKDGQTQIYTFKLNDLKSLESLKEVFKDLDIDVNMESLVGNHVSTCSQPAFLGVRLQDLTSQLRTYFNLRDGRGVLISEILEDSPAEKSGLKAGDVVIQVDDRDIHTVQELTKAIRKYKPEDKVTIRVNRKGRTNRITAILTERSYSSNIDAIFGGAHHPKTAMKRKMFKHHLEKFPMPDNFPDNPLHEDIETLRKELETLKQDVKELKN